VFSSLRRGSAEDPARDGAAEAGVAGGRWRLGRFCTEAGDQSTVGMEAREYLKTVLVKALGDKSAGIIERILQSGDTSGIETQVARLDTSRSSSPASIRRSSPHPGASGSGSGMEIHRT
jgi:hypothetical protein